MHGGQPRVFGSLINAARAFGLAIDLLQCHQIGLRRLDNRGDALQVQPPIDTFAVMEIVGHHPQCRPVNSRGAIRALATGSGRNYQAEQKRTSIHEQVLPHGVIYTKTQAITT